MINAGMNINYLIHNTLWVPGHFHLTVGTAFALTAMAVSYWLVPQVSGRRLGLRNVAAVQPYTWFIGMVLMSNAMHRAGLAGVPRRTAEPYEYRSAEIVYDSAFGSISGIRIQIALGGVLLFVALLMFLAVMWDTYMNPRGGNIGVSGEVPPALSGPENSPKVLDNLWLWTAIAVVLVILAYGLPIAGLVQDGVLAPGSPGFPALLEPLLPF
jgi:cytochrome c oxidase subunit 1